MRDLSERPIAVFDSGLGGISVLACALEEMPNEKFVYLGDLKNAPYGERTVENIRELVEDDFRLLLSYDVKAVIVACNTATACSVALLREKYKDIPIVGIEPAVKVAAEKCRGECAVLATPATLSLGMYKRLYDRFSPVMPIRTLPCPGLAAMIDRDASEEEIRDYLYSILPPDDEKVTSIVLGCTHYVLIAPLIGRLYPNCSIISGNEGTVRHAKRLLESYGLATSLIREDKHVTFLSTADTPGIEDRMRFVCRRARDERVWENRFVGVE